MPARTLLAERLDSEMLDALAVISVQDVYNAAAAWRMDAPERHKARLDAVAIATDD